MPRKTTDFNKAVAGRLRKLQEILELKQGEFAKLLGMTPQALSNVLAGDNAPKPWNLLSLKRAHGVTLDYIYADDRQGLPKRIADKLGVMTPVPQKGFQGKRKVA